METEEIPRERWTRFFDAFSDDHEGWIVSLDVLGPSLGAQAEVARLPLVGIGAQAEARKSCIEIIVGGQPDAQVTRVIESPQRVWLKKPEAIGHAAIDVESTDGTMTLMRFLHVEQPERLLSGPAERETSPERPYAAGAAGRNR